MHRPAPAFLTTCGLLAALLAAPLAAAELKPPPVRRSSPAWRALRELYRAGRPLDRARVERDQLDLVDEGEAWWPAPEDALRSRPASGASASVWLGPDVMANDRTGDVSCPGCAGRPLSQAETTIATWGPYQVAGWNDSKGFCGFGAVQGYATSTDSGRTFVDQGEVPVLALGGRFRGDPVHFVDTSTGEFYILGLHEVTLNVDFDMTLLSGHFAGGAWTIDGVSEIRNASPSDLDKPWGAVDPASHTLYITYSDYAGANAPRIYLIRSTDGGASWSVPLVMNDPSQDGRVQGSRVAVGPNGEVIEYWFEDFTTFASPFGKEHVRISTDGGTSFGPDVVAATFVENFTTGGAGYRRGNCPTFASLAVDRSSGPHRGRIYLAWDESVNFYDAPPPSLGDVTEEENNGTFANATLFTVGQSLLGSLTGSADSLDLWRFSGTRGQTVYFRSAFSVPGANFQMRIQCSSDTALFQDMRFLAFDSFSYANFLGYTLPYTGDYYLRIFRNATGTASYDFATSFDTPTPGDRARDHRDQFLCWSDDGLAWSEPVRLCDSPPATDGEFPEVAVDGRGGVHAYWHDWRDAGPCGAESAEYMVSSGDGGVTWGPNVRVSDATSFWSVNACGSANQGDYQGITTDGPAVMPCWADARNGDADVFTERVVRQAAATGPSSPRLAAGGTSLTLDFAVANRGNVSGDLHWRLADDAGWLAPGTLPEGTSAVGPGGTLSVRATLALPQDCVPAETHVRCIVEDTAIPGALDTCRVTLACGVLPPPGGVASLSLARPQPNPAVGQTVFTYALPHDGPVRLVIHGANGRRVRTLEDGPAIAGIHAVHWDGLDDAGDRAAPGMYWVRLEAAGRSLHQAVSLVR